MPDTLPTLPYLAGVLAVGMIAGIIRGLTGFGAALVIVPGLSLFVDPKLAVAAGMVAIAVTHLPLLPGARRNADYRTVLTCYMASVAALPLGVHLLVSLAPRTLQAAIGLSVILASLLLVRPGPRLPRAGVPIKLGAGLLSGMMNGSVGMGGPPVILLLLALPIPPVVARASLIVYFALLNATSLTLMAFQGLVDARTLLWAGLLIVPLALAARIGEMLFHRGGAAHFRPIALAVLVLTGLAALAKL